MSPIKVGNCYTNGRTWFRVTHVFSHHITVSWRDREERNLFIDVVKSWLETGNWVLLTPAPTQTSGADTDKPPRV